MTETVKPYVTRNMPGHFDSGGTVVMPFANDDEMNAILSAIRQSDTRIEGGGEPVEAAVYVNQRDLDRLPPGGEHYIQVRKTRANGSFETPLYASPAPEHVEGDVLSADHIADAGEMGGEMEATRWSAIGVGQMAADPEGRWVSIRDFDQAQSIIQRAERERDIADRNRNAARENFLTMQQAAVTLRKRAENAEAALAFVARWTWHKEGNGTSDAERLSAIKYHPTISTIGEKPDAE